MSQLTNIFCISNQVKTDLTSVFATKTELAAAINNPTILVSGAGTFTYSTSTISSIIVSNLSSTTETIIVLDDTSPPPTGTIIYIIADTNGYSYNGIYTISISNQSLISTYESWKLIRLDSTWLINSYISYTYEYIALELAVNLIVYWKFITDDISTSTSIRNYADSTYLATLSSGSSIDASVYRVAGRASMRSDAGNYVGFKQSTGTTYSTPTTGFTLAYWVKSEATDNTTNGSNTIYFTSYVNKGTGTSQTSGILLEHYYNRTSKTVRINWYITSDNSEGATNDSGASGELASYPVDTVNNWGHFAITCELNVVKIYINGNLAYTSNLNFNYAGRTFIQMILGANTSQEYTNNFNYAKFYYDEMRLYGYALSQAYITNLYKLVSV